MGTTKKIIGGLENKSFESFSLALIGEHREEKPRRGLGIRSRNSKTWVTS